MNGKLSLRFSATRAGAVSALLAPVTVAAAPATSAPRVDGTRLDRALRELVDMPGGPPGVIVVITRGRHSVVHTAGVAEIGTERPPRARDHMRIASVSKAFSAATALSLVADNLLSLKDTIGRHLPDLPEHWHRITLRQLLNHTSGIPDFTASDEFVDSVIESATSAPPPRALLEFVAGEPLGFTPGSQYRYSNSDNIVVALMVEAVTGRSCARALRRQTLQPLRLGRTSLPTDVDLRKPFIHGYAPGDSGEPEDVSEVVAFGGWAWASGGIVSTPADFTRFVRAYVGGGLLPKNIRARQFRFIPEGDSDPRGPGLNAAGLGLFRYRTACGTVYGHTGSILGYTQLIAATRDGRASVTFTMTTQIGDDALPALRHAQELAVCAALGKDGPRADRRTRRGESLDQEAGARPLPVTGAT
jgi:D-alanyl-D-alanine carboxypeptidase